MSTNNNDTAHSIPAPIAALFTAAGIDLASVRDHGDNLYSIPFAGKTQRPSEAVPLGVPEIEGTIPYHVHRADDGTPSFCEKGMLAIREEFSRRFPWWQQNYRRGTQLTQFTILALYLYNAMLEERGKLGKDVTRKIKAIGFPEGTPLGMLDALIAHYESLSNAKEPRTGEVVNGAASLDKDSAPAPPQPTVVAEAIPDAKPILKWRIGKDKPEIQGYLATDPSTTLYLITQVADAFVLNGALIPDRSFPRHHSIAEACEAAEIATAEWLRRNSLTRTAA